MIPLSQHQEGPVTFAEPDQTKSFGELALYTFAAGPKIIYDIATNPEAAGALFRAADRQAMLVETMTASSVSREQAYDRRIKAVKDATGISLDNPERYRMTERERRRLNEEGVEPTEAAGYPARLFEQRLAELRNAHPDKIDALTFGDVNEEAKAISKGAEDQYEAARKNTTLDASAALVTQFGGALWGQRRDPLFVGSMFAGPTTAVGKTVGARIATSGLFQGLYNMGIAALEQPAVQAWRREIGVRSGVEPALENIGLAFLFGAIPGAVIRGAHEIPASLRPSVQRVINGQPIEGDLDNVMKAARSVIGEIDAEMRAPAVTQEERLRVARLTGDVRAEREIISRSLQDAGADEAQLRDTMPDVDLNAPERVTAAATLYEGKVYTGAIHSDAVEKIIAATGATERDYERMIQGFVTSRGQFIGRAEAGLLTGGADEATLAVGRTVSERAIKLGEDMDAAERITYPRVARDVDPELHDDLAKAAQRYGDDPDNAPSPAGVAAVKYIEAFHGSPHSFDVFSSKYFGTGEGAASYGRGGYFAENVGVAKNYFDAGLTGPAGLAGIRLRDFHGSREQAIQSIKNSIESQSKLKGREDFVAELQEAKSLLEDPNWSPGNLYRVRIHADREAFLDWDKPLSEQPETVRAAAAEVVQAARDAIAARKIDADRIGTLSEGAVRGLNKPVEGMTGEDIRRVLVGAFGDEEASAMLREAGIPGIKYLDQGSREVPAEIERLQANIDLLQERIVAGTDVEKSTRALASAQERLAKYLAENEAGTRNFVVFDDALLQITHRNDVPLSPAMREISDRIAAAAPRNLAEAQKAASEAIEDIGNRESMARTRAELDTERLGAPKPIVRKMGDDRFEMSVFSNDGEKIGRIEFAVTDDAVIMRYPFIESEFQGKGFGVQAYQALVDWALAQGKKFQSDRSVSPSAVRIYEALERRGYKIIRPDEAVQRPVGNHDALQKAYDEIKEKQGRIGTVYISDLIERSGLSKQEVHEIVQQAASDGDLTLARTSIAEVRLSPQQREGALKIDDEVFHTVTLKRPIGQSSATKSHTGEPFQIVGKSVPVSSKDPLDKIPLARDDGTPTLVSAKQAALAGERETALADLIRECK